MIRYLKSTQSGRSMIEMLGVLAIVGVLSAGGIAGYSMAMQTHKTNTMIERISLIAMQTRKLYKGDYTDADIQDLVDAGKITDAKNPFGGTLAVSVSGWGNDTFDVAADGIPAEACVDLLTADWGPSSTFEGIWFSNSKKYRYKEGTYPISTATAISACKEDAALIRVIFR